nr:ribonuclease H-like domain-containing protein [Tanacetum cinerariifolium]
MSSITAQQTILDLELIPKEKRLETGKCNGRLNHGKKQREPTFPVVLDALVLTLYYFAFLITADVLEVYLHQFWDSIHKYENSYRFRMDKKKKFDLNLEIFRDIFQICPRVYGQNFDELPIDEDIVSFFKKLGHTGEIKTITNIVVDHMHQPWRTFTTIINHSLGKTTASPEEPTRKSKRVKRPVKKSFDASTAGVVTRETSMKSLSKKEKMIVEKCKGIDLPLEVALTEEAQHEEVLNKSLRDFHKTHPSGSGTVTKIAPSVAKIKSSVTNEGTSAKPRVPNVTEEESTEKENEEKIKDDEEEEEDEFVKISSNDCNDEDETKIKDKDEDEGMDYTTNQFDDDVDLRMNEQLLLMNGLEFFSPMDDHVHHEVPSKKTPTLLTLPILVITNSLHVYSTFIPQSLPSFTPLPQQSTPTPPPTVEATNPLSILPNFTSIFRFNNRVTTLKKEVAELKRNDPLNTQVTTLVDEHLDSEGLFTFKQGLVRGLPKLKFEKDHLCSACAMGKSTKKTHKPKSEDTNQEKLYLLHMDLCGPMRVESVNRKKYILVIVDDYSRFTWGVNINESLRVLIWSVWVLFPDVGSCSFWLDDIDLLLRKCVLDLLPEYGMLVCKRAKTPLRSKLDITNEATFDDPLLDNSHLITAFKILKYLRGSLSLGIHITKSPVSWKSKKHNTLSKSSTEAEYRALASVTSEVI